MGNLAMTIWNSTCNPCFSTFDQNFFVFHGLKTDFFCYSLKLNFICYPNRFFTYDYSLWDGGRRTFLRAKTIMAKFPIPENCPAYVPMILKEFCSSKINGLVMKTFSGK
jgi:hypothetical protein